MKRFLSALGLTAIVVLCTACPVDISGKATGFWQSRQGPASAPVSVDNVTPFGYDVIHSINPWNTMAGGKLLDAYPVGDQYGHANANIIFREREMDHAFWVQPIRDVNGWNTQCIIWYDTSYAHPSWMLTHELGHCLGFRGIQHTPDGSPYVDAFHQDYRGVMSYFDFHGCRCGWFNGDDYESVRLAGMRRW